VITAALVGAVLVPAPAVQARERVLTFYSPRIHSEPYVHDTHHVFLRPNGRQAPSYPGYITGFKEQVLVDSKDPDAKPLPNSKMMIHHFLYWARNRVDQLPGSCWGRSGFIAGRGEEHPSGKFSAYTPPAARRVYGINNRTPDGSAPTWALTAMVMNHYKRPKDFYVRTRIYYTTEQRRSVSPIVVGNCARTLNGMAYDVPGGGRHGSNFLERSTWRAPFSGRILMAHSHHHGGAKYHRLRSLSCNRTLFKARAYYGTRRHIYNTIRPILHEPGPVGNGAYGSMEGIPFRKGEVFGRRAVHDNSNLHVAAMGFWVLNVIPDNSVDRCEPLPKDITQLGKPRSFTRRPNYGLDVPQLYKPRGVFRAFTGGPLIVGDQFYPSKVSVPAGQVVTWRFSGRRAHSVTVANGPRGFSSLYTGLPRGFSYSYRPRVRGTYRLTCLIHPTTMGQTLRVK
jgi:plastocyanin